MVNSNVDDKKNFIEKRVDKLRRRKNSNLAMTVVGFYDFYKNEIYKKHIIIYIISLILFFTMLIYFSNADYVKLFGEILETSIPLGKMANFKQIFNEKLLLNFILLISGITPYVYIPILGIIYPYTLALNIVLSFNNIASNMNPVFMTIGSIIQILGISFTISAGIYLCKVFTKRFKYSQKANFTFNDVKKEYYSIKNNKKKYNEALKKEEKRKKEIEALNVKVPYKNIIISFVMSSLIIVIGGIIALI